MRLDALETEDMLTQKATNKKREGDGDKEGLLLDQKGEAICHLGIFQSNHKATSDTDCPTITSQMKNLRFWQVAWYGCIHLLLCVSDTGFDEQTKKNGASG